MYHGTDDPSFDPIDGNPSSRGAGLCLTKHWDVAKMYATRWGSPGYIYEIEGVYGMKIMGEHKALQVLGERPKSLSIRDVTAIMDQPSNLKKTGGHGV
jgi:hypothetical protein